MTRRIGWSGRSTRQSTFSNSFFNEFLNSDFANFRRVMEALGSKAHVATVDDQLSGVGFAYTQHATVILKINDDKVYNVKF